MDTISQNDRQLTKDELIEAITYFVRRQELVAQALIDFGLDLDAIAILGAGGWTLGADGAKQLSEVTPNNFQDEFRSALQRMIENNSPKLNQTGSWQDKNGGIWNYFMHGGGCLLINQVTGEPIDWDCPSTIDFDAFKFCSYLKWQIEKFPNKYPHLTRYLRNNEIRTIEHNLIPELVNEGKLNRYLTNLYRIS
jgi:uncharacterized protein DUF6896